MFIGYSSTCESKGGGVALDEALSIIQRCSVKSEVLLVLLLTRLTFFIFFSLGVEVKHRANTNSFPVFQKDKSARTSFLHQTAGSDLFFFSCRVKKFCCFTRTEVRFLNVVWSGKPEGRHISLSLSVSCLSLGRNGARSKWFSSEKPDHNLINAGSPLWAAPSWGSNARHWFVFHL